MRITTRYTWLMLASLSCLVATLHAAEPVEWRRHPIATIPHVANAPTIDGNIDRAEWVGAVALGPLLQNADGVNLELEHNTWVCYDAINLYIAFDIVRPTSVRKPESPADGGRIDRYRAGDSVELMIDVGFTAKRFYGFVIYPNGAFADGLGSPGVDRSWNVEWTCAASVTEQGWQGEVAIPFTSLDMGGPPKPGDRWGFDIVDNQKTPFRTVGLWAYRGPGWHKYANLGRIDFGDATAKPTVHFNRVGEAGRGHALVDFEIVNPSSAGAVVKAEVQLLRRKDGAAGGPKSYFDHIESGGDDAYDTGAVDYEKTTSLDGLIEEALRFYDPVEDGTIAKRIDVPAGERRPVGMSRPIKYGEFLVLYNFTDATDQTIFAGARVFRIEPPLALDAVAYWLHSKKLKVEADLRKVAFGEGATLTAAIAAESGKRLVESTSPLQANQPSASLQLSTADINPGFYKVIATLRNAKGEVIAENSLPVESPEVPQWHGNSYGKVPVPQPWTPLTASPEGKVSMWGRTYDLATAMPRSIVTQGSEILAAPIALDVRVDGKSLPWRVTSLKSQTVDAGKTIYDVTLQADGVTLTGTMTVEFDGLVWYDLVLSPTDGALEVDGVELAVGMKPAHAKRLLHHRYMHDPALSRKPIEPAKTGPKGVLAETWIPFSPYVWMGDETGGIAFVAEAPIDWKIKDPASVIRITPSDEGGPAKMRARFVDHATKLAKPMRIVFGLQASPIKPIEDENVIHLAQSGGPVADENWYKGLAEAGCRSIVFHGGWKGPKTTEWSGWPSQPKSEQRRQQLKDAIKMAHKYGMTVSLYTGWGVAVDSPEWKHFRYEMTRAPLENSGFGTYRQSAGLNGAYIDYMAWIHGKLIEEYDYDGVFWDSASNLSPDQHLEIGNAWVDDKGRQRPKYALLATRELFRRVYNLTHGGIKRDGRVVNFGGSIWAINAYADIFHRGEGTPMHVQKLRDAWAPMEDYRSNYDGRSFGLPFLAMNKNFKRLAMTVNQHHAVTLLHGSHCKSSGAFLKYPDRTGYGLTEIPFGHIWQARDWLPFDSKMGRHTYYTDGPKLIHLEPASLLSSVFTSGDKNRALLVVSNLDDQPVKEARVTIDLPAMHMLSPGSVKIEDALTGEPVEHQDGVVSIDIEMQRFRLLKIWQQ